MSDVGVDNIKCAIVCILNEANSPVPPNGFLHRIVEKGYNQIEVVSALREMFEAGDIRFDADMRVCLTREMA